MKYDPRHLVQFAAIIEEGSFSLAAERLGTTQPALSSMVKTLETRAGLDLLARRRRPVTPTPLGAELARMGELVNGRAAESKLAAELTDLRDIALETLEGVERIERVVADMRRLSAAPGDGFTAVDLNDVARDAARNRH